MTRGTDGGTYSVNVPVPPAVRSLVADLRPALTGFERVRQRPTLVCKRLPATDRRELLDAERRARDALAGLPPFAARVDGVDAFEEPVNGPGPVVYLSVTSPGLRAAHRRLVDEFRAVDRLEGDEYTPHVTLARGLAGRPAPGADPVERLRERDVEPVEWEVTEVEFYDATYEERVDAVSLPA